MRRSPLATPVDGAWEFVTCRSVEARKVTVQARIDGEWSTWFVTSEPTNFRKGEPIDLYAFAEQSGGNSSLRLEAATGFGVSIAATTSSDNLVAAFDLDELGTDDWLRPDGSLSADPCDGT